MKLNETGKKWATIPVDETNRINDFCPTGLFYFGAVHHVIGECSRS